MGKRITIRCRVVGFNSLQYKGKIVNCWTNASDSAGARQPLDLSQHEDEVVEVGGTLHTDLWEAQFVRKFDKPKEAKSLRDLMQIREDNRGRIKKAKNLGSALGFKWAMKKNTKRPCVIIFVKKKIKPGEADTDELIPEVLEGKNGTWCLTDVVAGGETGNVASESLPELSPGNKKVVETLNSGKSELTGGIRLAYDIGDNEEGHGTAGIAVKNREGHIGFLTNQHVASDGVREIYHPHLSNTPIGSTYNPGEYSVRYTGFKKWYGIKTGNTRAQVKCDFGFIKIDDSLKSKVRPGLFGIGNVGPVKKIDIDTMDIIGQKVISVGCSRGIQRGMVVAYSYEWKIMGIKSIFNDLLITGEEGGAFSYHGDSGKIIVTDDEEHLPLALHWGGVMGLLDDENDEGQQSWSKASELNKILEHSGLNILE